MKSLKDLRLEAGLTMGQLAKKIGVSGMAIGRYESGECSPRPYLIPKIAEFFGISPQEAREAIEESARQSKEAKETSVR